jgi:hypothetical protein
MEASNEAARLPRKRLWKELEENPRVLVGTVAASDWRVDLCDDDSRLHNLNRAPAPVQLIELWK